MDRPTLVHQVYLNKKVLPFSGRAPEQNNSRVCFRLAIDLLSLKVVWPVKIQKSIPAVL